VKSSPTDSIMAEYESKLELYKDFTEEMRNLVEKVLKDHKKKLHSVSSRTKDKDSLLRKISRPDRQYGSLDDVTDISGVRIVTFFSDDVDFVGKTIEEVFDIDWDKSVDKRLLLDPDRFGYLSMQYVGRLTQVRKSMPEYKRFGNMPVEIQVRSILQHAWAEIEHDYGYKSKAAIPRDVRRRFSRLAGLLEIVDTEFVSIRDNISEYISTVKKSIRATPSSVMIDQESLFQFVETDPLLKEINEYVADSKKKVVRYEDKDHLGSYVGDLKYVGIKTIADLKEQLHYWGEILKELSKKLMEQDLRPYIPSGTALYHLCYVILASTGDVHKMVDYLNRFHILHAGERRKWAEDVIQIYQTVRNSQKTEQ